MPTSELLRLPPGEIKTSVVLDRELRDAYRLLAQATDGGGRWCRAEVKLKVTDVNDNPPVFTQAQYSTSIYEDTVPKALLSRTPAIDPDEGDTLRFSSSSFRLANKQTNKQPRFPDFSGPGRIVTYSLVDDAGGSFSIDKTSGILVLERFLDREVQSAYQVTVRASDRGAPTRLSSFANVTVTILDVNDNPPVFEHRDQLVTVPEDVALGTEVLRVHAASKDIGTNAEITYSIRSGNEHGKFHVHPRTGE